MLRFVALHLSRFMPMHFAWIRDWHLDRLLDDLAEIRDEIKWEVGKLGHPRDQDIFPAIKYTFRPSPLSSISFAQWSWVETFFEGEGRETISLHEQYRVNVVCRGICIWTQDILLRQVGDRMLTCNNEVRPRIRSKCVSLFSLLEEKQPKNNSPSDF